MATSGSNSYSINTRQIIERAFLKATIYRTNSSLPTEDYNNALEELNTLVKGWQSMGYNIWKDKRATLFLQKEQASYTLSSSGDHATESFVSTTLSADASSGAGTVDVTSITGISSGDNIGIVKDDGYIFWTTVNGAPAGSTVTLTANLDGDAASGNVVYTYTTKITKPLEIREVMLVQNSSNEVNLYRLQREQYFELANKTSEGSPSQYYYQRNRIDGTLYLWTVPTDVTQYIQFTYQPYIDDFLVQANEPDFPIEWANPLIWNLALELCLTHGKTGEIYERVKENASYWLDMAKSNDNENGKLTFGTNIWQ